MKIIAKRSSLFAVFWLFLLAPPVAAEPGSAAIAAPEAADAKVTSSASSADSEAAFEKISEPAPATIGRLNATLIDIMQRAEGLGYGGRFEVVAPVVTEIFDITFMAAKSIGRHWRKLSREERVRWVKTFEAFMISNFADRFDGFSGETFDILGEKPASRETLVVLTRLNRPGEDAVDLDYRMREEDAGWRVVDIYSDGTVSEVALRRSEYSAVLKSGGIEKLIAAVTAKTRERATQ